jgi:hypothetical protein
MKKVSGVCILVAEKSIKDNFNEYLHDIWWAARP